MPATKVTCPQCGAEIIFRTSIAAYSTCPYCRTMVVRTDDGIKNLGTMAQLPDDMSPFQIGAEGYFKGVHFGIVGRMRIGYEDGSWNEWFMVSDDMKRGWLAEAQGFYAPCFDTTDELSMENKGELHQMSVAADASKGASLGELVDHNIPLKYGSYRVVDVKQAECIGSEGELPFKAAQGRKTWSIDLVHGDNLFASIEFADEGVRVFEGAYTEWPDLRCSNYRHFEGW